MIVEQRIYTLNFGSMAGYLAVYEQEGLPIQRRHLPRLLGAFTTDIGPLNQATYLWAYADFAERARCRSALSQDPEWPGYVSRIQRFIQAQENRILLPTTFSPGF